MTQFLQVLSALREQMQASLARSDALKPLAWLVGLLLLAIVLVVSTSNPPEWLIILMSALAALAVAAYVGAYVYLLFADRDALRSERYTLHKMALEHGLIGDSTVGLFDEADLTDKTPPVSASKQIEVRS